MSILFPPETLSKIQTIGKYRHEAVVYTANARLELYFYSVLMDQPIRGRNLQGFHETWAEQPNRV